MKTLLEKIRKILRDRKFRRFWTRLVSAIAAFVVFVTTYALVLPAITMEKVTDCGMEEHQHDDSCYLDVLICGMEESEEHHHDASCYEKQLICGKEAHTHSAACYQTGGSNDGESVAVAEEQTISVDVDTMQEDSAGSDSTQWSSNGEDTEQYGDTEPQNAVPGGMIDAQNDPAEGEAGEPEVVEVPLPFGDQNAEGENIDAELAAFNDSPLQFDDSIESRGGNLGTDVPDSNPGKTRILVHVEAEEGTFPEGTTMILSAVDDINAVAEAVEGAVEGKTRGFHAVDISFQDADGNEIEPLKPVRVSMTGETIQQAVEEPSAAPVVVHIENQENNETAAYSGGEENAGGDSGKNPDETAAVITENKSGDGSLVGKIVETSWESSEKNGENSTGTSDAADTLTFEAGSFSVYAIVYTVDFAYEVNGKVYGFTMQGADSVSLRALVEALHVYEAVEKSITDFTDIGSGLEGEVRNEDLTETDVVQNIDLDRFMDEINNVTFSDEKLLVPAKVQEDTTAGKIKTELNLFPTYPLGLTQSEVLELNAKSYTAGDWALISIKPFDTEETLTITMINGESFEIKVTDAQDAIMVGDQVQTISNPAGTTIDLFDYWIIDQEIAGRDGWGDLNQGWGAHGDTDGLNGSGNNKGINSSVSDTEHGHALKFSPAWEGTVFNGTKNSWTSLNTNGRDGLNSYTGNADPFQGIVSGTLVDGYPVLTDNDVIGSNGESLAYLFNPGIDHDGKASYPGVDQLLYVDKDGYYTYDSRDYRADFNDGAFVLTEQTSDNSEVRGFWPFGTQNFWTGLHINTQFSMPVNGQVLNPRGEYKDMQFEFSGDDDTWLYVDGVLVGDGGGIHNRTEIDVNFAEGTVTVTGKEGGEHSGSFEEIEYMDDIFKAAGKYNEEDWEEIGDGSGHKRFKPGTYHTFDMFYLERGGGESNLYLHYNLVSTADFTAHKSYDGYDDEDVMLRNQFRFELAGLDGKYRSMWSEETGDYVLVREDSSSRAVMPHASSNGAGTTVSPYYNDNTTVEMSDGSSVRSQIYITGNVEDGNINFGTAEISEQDMHDCDEGNPPVYRYIIREVIPDDAVNAQNIRWADATPEQRAAGGFVKDSIVYDNTVFYMTATVTSWTETDAGGVERTRYGLNKTYYTDDSFTTKKEETQFVDFRNGYTPDLADFEFDKINAKEEPVKGAVFGLFRDSACKIPAKDSSNQQVTAISDDHGKVKFSNVRTGIYYLKEIGAPESYDLNPAVYRVTISKQGSYMSDNIDQDNKPVTEVLNLKPDDLTVMKKWYDAYGNEVSGEGYPATVQLRRYHYVRTGPEPETHNVTLKFHFPDAGWNEPDKTFGPYEITGNSVVIHWKVDGCQFFWDEGKTQVITDSNNDNLVQLPLDRDLVLDFYGNRDWASGNLNESIISVDGAFDDSKELQPDEDFPAEEERAAATKILTKERSIYAWSIGTGDGYDFPAGNEISEYLYYVVELDPEGNAVEPGGDAGNGMKLISIEYNPEKTEGKGINHGLITVSNELPGPENTSVVIRKTDDAENSTNYLDGAVFKLMYRKDSTGTFTNASKDTVPELDSESKFTVPKTGITLTGLVDGQYQLQEISSPAGYVITNKVPVTFTVQGGAIISTDSTIPGVRYTAASESADAEFIIPNTPGASLPNTGGPGTRLYTILGSMIITVTGLLLWRRRRII